MLLVVLSSREMCINVRVPSFIQNAPILECCRRYREGEYQWNLIKYLNPAFIIFTVCILVAGKSAQCNNVLIKETVAQGATVQGPCDCSCSGAVKYTAVTACARCLFNCHYVPQIWITGCFKTPHPDK